jgi:hypothetical protein
MPSKTLAALAAAAIMLVGAGTADAHTLSKGRAFDAAFHAASAEADASARYFEYVEDVGVSSCTRFTRHSFSCVATARFRTYEEWEYEDGTTLLACVGRVSVRFASRYSYRLVTRVFDVDCF